MSKGLTGKKIFAFLFLVILSFPIRGQERLFNTAVSLDWIRASLYAQVNYDLSLAGIRLPAGRPMGEETLKTVYPSLLRPHLLSIRVDSNTTIRDLVDRGEISLGELDRFSREAAGIPPFLSADFTRMIGRYTINLEALSSSLLRHRRAVESNIPLIPAQTSDYTGIIIIANEELPIHGRNSRALAEPCLFPKIWDTDMNLIYERNMLESGGGKLMARYAIQESIFRPTPSGLDDDLAGFLGQRPLRIIARGVFGARPTDFIIDRDDALKILSSENNRRLLREGRVLLVLNETVLASYTD